MILPGDKTENSSFSSSQLLTVYKLGHAFVVVTKKSTNITVK